LLKDDEAYNAFHVAASAAKMVRENLHWITIMLGISGVNVDARTHRQVTNLINGNWKYVTQLLV
jgi:E3 ubiquitin-protein ligase KEG